MSEPSQRRLAAILAADVVGYSLLMGADQERTLRALRQLRAELFVPLVRKHRGNLIKNLGDGWIVEFPSISDAVNCGIEVQSGLIGHELVRLRMGIHTGEVVFEAEDVFGDGVNVAARLEALAEPGQVLISDNALQSLDGKLAERFTGGESHQLRNIARPVAVWRWPGTSRASSSETAATAHLPLPENPSIAVMAFVNKSSDPEQEYFADGLTDDITTALARFRSFFVIARNSTLAYKDKSVDLATVGRELGVRYVVEGSVRKAGNRIRVTAQLIEAASDKNVWAEHYDREIDDIFELQDEIAETIVGAVEQEIGTIERTRSVRKRPENLHAWDLLQRGLFHVLQMSRNELETGLEIIEQSVAQDPTFAEAHAWLSFSHLHLLFLGAIDDFESILAKAEFHAKEAVKYDSRSSVGHEMMARVLCFRHQFDEAIAAAQRALELNPNASATNFSLAVIYHFSDRNEDVIGPVDRAIRLSPKDHRKRHHLMCKGAALVETGKLDEGTALLRQSETLQAGDYRVHLILARAGVEAGDMAMATESAKRVLALIPEFTLDLYETKLGQNFHPNHVRRFLGYLQQIDVFV